MLDFDLIFESCGGRMREIFAKTNVEAQKTIQSAIVELFEMSRIRRCDEFKAGKLLTQIRMALVVESDLLAAEFIGALGPHRKACSTAMRIYDRFRSHEDLLELIHVNVQRYVADHEVNRGVIADLFALAKQGREVTFPTFEADILSCYTEAPALKDEQLAIAAAGLEEEDEEVEEGDEAESVPDGPAIAAPRVVIPDPDDDGWDIDEEVPAMASDARTITAQKPLNKEKVDVRGMKEVLMRNAFREISGAIRGIDAFCTDNGLTRGPWFSKFRTGADMILESLREWNRTDSDHDDYLIG